MAHRLTVHSGFAKPLVLGLSVLAFGCLALGLAASSYGSDAAKPGEKERYAKISREVTQLFREGHYRRAVVDDTLSAAIFDKYLGTLDPSRRYITADDVAQLSRYRLRLDEAVVSGDVEPAFKVFNTYRDLARKRINFALSMLDKEPDFTVEEDFAFDREGVPWASNEDELKELWRKIVKNDALSLVMAEKSWDETREILSKRYERVLKRLDQISNDEVFESFMNAYAFTLDPHSNYYSPRATEDFRIQMSLSYEGIGASLQSDDDYVKVMNIIPGGPAAAKGDPQPNDRIIGVGQGPDGEIVDVIGWRLDDVVQLIRGPGGRSFVCNCCRRAPRPATKARSSP